MAPLDESSVLQSQTPMGWRLQSGHCQYRVATETGFASEKFLICLNSCMTTSSTGKAINYQNIAALFLYRRHLLSQKCFDFPAKRTSYQESKPHLSAHGVIQVAIPQHLLPLLATVYQGKKNLYPMQFKLMELSVTWPCSGAAHQPINHILAVPRLQPLQLGSLQSNQQTKPKQTSPVLQECNELFNLQLNHSWGKEGKYLLQALAVNYWQSPHLLKARVPQVMLLRSSCDGSCLTCYVKSSTTTVCT